MADRDNEICGTMVQFTPSLVLWFGRHGEYEIPARFLGGYTFDDEGNINTNKQQPPYSSEFKIWVTQQEHKVFE